MSRARKVGRLGAPPAGRGTFSDTMAIADRKEAAPGKIYVTGEELAWIRGVRKAPISISPPAAPNWPSIEARQRFAIDMVLTARKSGPLIDYLRDGEPVTPEMSALLADLLAGRRKAKPEPAKWQDWAMPIHYEALIRAWEKSFRESASDPELYATLRFILRFVFHFDEPYPVSRAAERRAALFITRKMLNLTPAQLDERRFPRLRRKGA